MLSVIYSGVEKDNEAICSVGGLSSYLPSNRSLGIPDTADWVMNAAELSKSQYVNFSYNIDCQDSLKGFMLHNLTVLLSKKRQ
jgi:hypothetical protein